LKKNSKNKLDLKLLATLKQVLNQKASRISKGILSNESSYIQNEVPAIIQNKLAYGQDFFKGQKNKTGTSFLILESYLKNGLKPYKQDSEKVNLNSIILIFNNILKQKKEALISLLTKKEILNSQLNTFRLYTLLDKENFKNLISILYEPKIQ